MSTSSSLFTPLQFTGISQYSSDFQSILSRATSIAEIPVQALQQQEAKITQQETDLSNIGTDVSAVQAALVALGGLGSGQALAASSTDGSVVKATNTSATAAAAYSITNVTSLASAASESSAASYATAGSTAVSATGKLQLLVGAKAFSINLTPANNNLNGLVSAINALGAGVTASAVTSGSRSYLIVSAANTGATTLKLNDDPTGANTDLLTANNQGTNTNFKLNGIAVSEASATVTDVIPGVTLTFGGTSAANENISVGLATDPTQISGALQKLVSSYNALRTATSAQIGSSAGSLAGNNIVYQISQQLSSIVQYQGSTNGMSNLANLGVSIGNDGQMSFDATAFSGLSASQINSSLTLFGSATTGLGGLQQSFSGLTDPTTGTIVNQETQWAATVTKLSAQISDRSATIRAMEQTLDQQLQRADASVAQLASQQNILTASITSLNYTAYGTNTSSAKIG